MTAGHNGTGVTENALREAAMLRREVRDGRFQRSMAVITGLSAIVSGAEAYTQHRRGAFSHRLMWTPVWLMPPAAIAAAAAVLDERAARRLLPALSAAVIVDGVVGFAYHVRGIRRMPGGFRVGQYNVVMGPPIFAPLLMCSVGVAGVLTGLLQRSRPARKRRSALLGGLAAAVGQLVAGRGEPAGPGRGRRSAHGAGRGGSRQGRGLAGLADLATLTHLADRFAGRAPQAGRSTKGARLADATRLTSRFAKGAAMAGRLADGVLAGRAATAAAQANGSSNAVRDGQLQRGLAITTAALGAVAGGEAYFEHLRGSFNNRLMWTPVWLTPPMVAAAAGAAVSERVARRVLPIASAVTLADGALGFTLHLRGLQRMPGDTGNANFKITMGPPLFAPLLFSAVGMFGLVASLLRGARDR